MNIRSDITQTWTCRHCRTTLRHDVIGAIVEGIPAPWHDLNGQPFCSTRCLALAVLAMPDARPHIIAQLAAEATT